MTGGLAAQYVYTSAAWSLRFLLGFPADDCCEEHSHTGANQDPYAYSSTRIEAGCRGTSRNDLASNQCAPDSCRAYLKRTFIHGNGRARALGCGHVENHGLVPRSYDGGVRGSQVQ